VSGVDKLFGGFFKCEYQAGGVSGRSVMYVYNGKMLGGNSAFAHVGEYKEEGGEIVAEISGQRHNIDPRYQTLYGSDTASISVRGRVRHGMVHFEGGTSEAPGAVFRAVLTPLDDGPVAVGTSIGDGGIGNGLYSIHIQTLDGVDGGLTGVILLFDGRILGGDAFFYYLGTYSSARGRWKGEIVNQEHTPANGEVPVFGGHEVGIGFSGTCTDHGAELEATAFAGKRSIRLTASLRLLHRA
jgi:hypothetical protein